MSISYRNLAGIEQLIQYVYDSQFTTEWLKTLAEFCDFCIDYSCSNIDEFLQQQFLFGYDIRYEIVKHVIRYIMQDASYSKLCCIWDFILRSGYDSPRGSNTVSVLTLPSDDDDGIDFCIEAAIKDGDEYRNFIFVNLSDGKYIKHLI